VIDTKCVRIVPEFPRLMVSDTGVLWGPSGRRLKPFPDRRGYLRFNLYRGSGQWTQHGVHAAVCIAFHGPRPDGLQVRHLDGNPLNNHASNLVWGTQTENESDKVLHGTRPMGMAHPHVKLTEADVRAIREHPRYYGFRRDLAVRYGISVGTVSEIRAGVTWRHL
jgi:hypothetical protein